MAGQSPGETAESHQRPIDARDAGSSAYPQRQDFGAPASNQPAPQGDNEGDDNRRDVSDAEDLGVYASYGRHIGGVQLAANSIPMDELGITEANPADWANVTRLVGGALELSSGQIIAATTLLVAMDAHTERADAAGCKSCCMLRNFTTVVLFPGRYFFV